MVVACIYCIVIIYIPSIEEQKSTILPEPKRCVTTEVSRKLSFIILGQAIKGKHPQKKNNHKKHIFINQPPKPVKSEYLLYEKIKLMCTPIL